MTTLHELAALLDAATGPSREIDEAIAMALHLNPVPCTDGPELTGQAAAWAGGGEWWDAPDWSFSTDAALALMGRLLPGWYWEVWGEKVHDTGDDDCFGSCLCHSGNPDDDVRANAPTAPLAILKALVPALITKETAK
jgi:hypothetical protein